MTGRDNQAWLQALRAAGSEREFVQGELRQVIVSSLPLALSRPAAFEEGEVQAFAQDIAQETLLRVLDHLASFEGRSRSTIWVLKISVRVALTELRRRHWQDVLLSQLESEPGDAAGRLSCDEILALMDECAEAVLQRLSGSPSRGFFVSMCICPNFGCKVSPPACVRTMYLGQPAAAWYPGASGMAV